MPKETYRVSGFTRKGGVRVAGHTREKPTLSAGERARRARLALVKLVPAAKDWVGKAGFDECVANLRGKPEIRNPELLCGWLKGGAKERGTLSPAHKYVGRKGFRKYTIGGRKVTSKEYYAKRGRPGERVKRYA